MSAPDLPLTPAPAELVAQWTPKLRRIAWQTGADLDDISQQAWLLAATMRQGPDLVPRWLTAVRRHALAQAKQRIIAPPPELVRQVELAGGCADRQEDDPAAELDGAQAVAKRMEGRDVAQIVGEPRTAREIAMALKKSERQGRRIRRRLDEWARVQGDFWPEAAV